MKTAAALAWESVFSRRFERMAALAARKANTVVSTKPYKRENASGTRLPQRRKQKRPPAAEKVGWKALIHNIFKDGGDASCSHKPSFWNRYAVR